MQPSRGPGLHIPCVQVCRVMSKTKALAHPLIRVGSRQQIVYPQKLKGDLKKFRAHYLARHFEDNESDLLINVYYKTKC